MNRELRRDERRCQNTVWRSFFIQLLLVSTGVIGQQVCFAQSTPSSSQSFTIQKLPQVVKEVNQLVSIYLDPEIRVRENRFIVKLNEGRLLYFNEDYRTAAMTLLELVETYNKKKDLPIYKDALFYLADSLYHIGNYRTAARFFEEVLSLNEKKMRPCALGRLLEISMELKEAAAPQVYYQEALKVANQYEEGHLFYLLGKYSYQVGEYQRAINLWERLNQQSSAYPQARYFRGVALVQQEDYPNALKAFKEVVTLDLELLKLGLSTEESDELAPEVDVVTGAVIDREASSRSQTRVTGCTFRSSQEREAEIRGWELVRAHAELAIGRILYEQGELDQSLSAYLEIDRSSPLFREAIKESVWVSIKKGNYYSALQQMDVQLIDEPDMLNDPFTRLLQGRLLSILERFADAQSIFSELKTRFENFRVTSLSPIERKARGQLASYFQSRLEQGSSALNLESVLPRAAMQFAGKELSSNTSRSLFVELSALEQDITFSKDAIKDLYWVLGVPSQPRLKSGQEIQLTPGQSEIFPQLHRGLLKALELRYQLFAAQVAINEKQAISLKGQSEYQKLYRTRTLAGQALEGVPMTEVQLDEREAKIGHELMLQDLKLFRLGVSLKNKRAQLIALKSYLENAQPDEIVGALGPKERASALKSVKQELEEHDVQLKKLEEISDEIKQTYLHIGLFDEVYLREEAMRRDYFKAIDRESEWLNGQGLFSVEQLDELVRAHKTLDDFQRRSLRLISESSDRLRAQVFAEEEKIKKYELQLDRLNRQAKRLAGQMVARTYYDILKKLNELILEADAGILDMLWAQKNQSSDRAQSQVDRRRMHFEVLKRDVVH